MHHQAEQHLQQGARPILATKAVLEFAIQVLEVALSSPAHPSVSMYSA
jgi:hypothetical protein